MILAVDYWAALILGLFALVLIGLYRQQPGCPACGSRRWQSQAMPHVRLCRDCLELYKTREA